MTDVDYEKRVLEGVRKALLNPECGPGELDEERFAVEEVRMDPSATDPRMIVILYRDRSRPKCLFGYRVEAMEPAEWYADGSSPMGSELWTTIVWANFREYVVGTPYGLPKDCSPEGINWTT